MSWSRTVLLVLLASGLRLPDMLEAASARPAAPPQASLARSQAAARAGWDAIREGRILEAADAFDRAIDAEPRDPSLHLGAGLTAFLLGRSATAQQSLERALSIAPELTAASALLGDILYRGSDVDGAIRVYEAALKSAPADLTLKNRLSALRREVTLHAGFFQSQGSHFVVLFEGPADEELARRALDILEAAYWRIGTVLSVYPERVVTVVLYTEEQFRDVTESPPWAAAAYDGRIRVPVGGIRTSAQELDRVLAHEFTHTLVQSLAPRGVPTWLHEGLAVLFEPAGDAWADAQLAASPRRLPLDILTRSFRALASGDARLAYAQSAAAARVLLNHNGAAALVALLQDIAAGDGFSSAFERRMFMPYDSFAATLESGR